MIDNDELLLDIDQKEKYRQKAVTLIIPCIATFVVSGGGFLLGCLQTYSMFEVFQMDFGYMDDEWLIQTKWMIILGVVKLIGSAICVTAAIIAMVRRRKFSVYLYLSGSILVVLSMISGLFVSRFGYLGLGFSFGFGLLSIVFPVLHHIAMNILFFVSRKHMK